MELYQASHQWASRPADQRFTDLIELRDHFAHLRQISRELVVANRDVTCIPVAESNHKGLQIVGKKGAPYTPTHWAFGQLASLAGAPAGYLRTLPAELAADNLNYGLKIKRDVEEIGLLLQAPNGDPNGTARAATGPRYGRIWNVDVVEALVSKFGDGVSGDWRVPGEFGRHVAVTQANTTLYASDRDLFVFLADEDHRIEIPNRRNGQPGTLARGFFTWNSEVGAQTYGLATFLFDYTCCNRIVWGAEGYQEIRIRHTTAAPDRWIEEVAPALVTYANSSSKGITDAIANARQSRLTGDGLDEFLKTRFGPRLVPTLKEIHRLEEDRPIENVWDVTVAATAYARSIKWQDERVDFERKAGALLKAAA